ncbi:carboxylesterase/lipase family protein [Sulfobacillus harzensis]|uniref:Carboxylic ester hydrolase n=1 Tax=Sulfobacillus harzensis TaxID=2729629 RepID=A0A7Y0Q140_9FIRM|nr:carboxylesterase/lipase family protein [Sulfobacillus harzensis]NMP20900.1 carboxylesterase/lipase family protein [Sulfobacillus harzensis]
MNSKLVETRYGKVEGIEQDGVLVWKNVPFASVQGRFQPPKPPVAWTGVRDASAFGPVCTQTPAPGVFSQDQANYQSEDCLNLNIWSPRVDGAPRPVLVWIHGGAFVFGSGQSAWYEGTSFARRGNMVVVTINYRLGPFGFLYLDRLAGPDYAGSGNVAFLDQQAALAWVRENIRAFGGDPERITVAGQSAGSMSVGTLLAMPSARQHIDRAIMQSGAPFFKTADEADRITQHFLGHLQLTPEQWPQLLELPTERLLMAQGKLEQEISLPWGPVVDQVVISQPLELAIDAGDTAGIPLLIGTTRDEFNLWGAMNPAWRSMPSEQMIAVFEHVAGGPLDERLRDYYVAGKSGIDLFQGLMALATDRIFWYPSERVAERQSRVAPVWAYRFDWPSQISGGVLGACHAIEIPFVFNTIDVPGGAALTGQSPNRQAIADAMHQAWIAYVHGQNPVAESLPIWPPYRPDDRQTMIFDVESHLMRDPKRAEREVWDALLSSKGPVN